MAGETNNVTGELILDLLKEQGLKIDGLAISQTTLVTKVEQLEKNTESLKEGQKEISEKLEGPAGLTVKSELLKARVDAISSTCAARIANQQNKDTRARDNLKSIIIPIVVSIVLFIIYSVIPHVITITP